MEPCRRGEEWNGETSRLADSSSADCLSGLCGRAAAFPTNAAGRLSARTLERARAFARGTRAPDWTAVPIGPHSAVRVSFHSLRAGEIGSRGALALNHLPLVWLLTNPFSTLPRCCSARGQSTAVVVVRRVRGCPSAAAISLSARAASSRRRYADLQPTTPSFHYSITCHDMTSRR